ncbi:MAG TPA: DinB family protein [Streptosporangiaceae bacterium]|nr:DinB family protein [Streptosporangiaceae bacterium]
MAETQRQPVPRNDSGELDTALAFLNFNRESVLKKADGLDDKQLRRRLVPTGTNLLGLMRHLAGAERYWFGLHLTGVKPAGGYKFGMRVPARTTAEEVISDYRSAIAESNAAIIAAGDPQTLLVKRIDGQRLTLRWLLAHMTSETARHAGHADILREQIDGATGR